ncbi:hypothetical protein FDA94_24865 [Herbidospora galbida]|uniref:Uncharacterized protein n=1 Tax=Herbidospora galbida TaxID=2575442 RepID=A0A4U3MD91_9ACTN|nr:hypothetical protein [Herbidospora galbida]TKK85626.1 hypothetical protein FDA94_24865 [Herbidospora galbida]
MPTTQHDSLNQLFRERPQLALDLVRRAKLLEVPDGLPVRAHQLELSDRVSKELRPDLLLTLGPEREPYAALIVEMQLQPSEAKARQLPRYAAAVWLHLDCPVHVVVVCPDRRTARWAASRMPTELETFYIDPLAVGPDSIPVVGRVQAAENPHLAVLSLMAHGADREVVADIMRGFKDLPPGDAASYYEYTHQLAALAVKANMEEFMLTNWPVNSPTGKKYVGVGRVEQGVADVLAVLEARKIALTDEQRARITECAEPEHLSDLVVRAALVDDAAELFV